MAAFLGEGEGNGFADSPGGACNKYIFGHKNSFRVCLDKTLRHTVYNIKYSIITIV